MSQRTTPRRPTGPHGPDLVDDPLSPGPALHVEVSRRVRRYDGGFCAFDGAFELGRVGVFTRHDSATPLIGCEVRHRPAEVSRFSPLVHHYILYVLEHTSGGREPPLVEAVRGELAWQHRGGLQPFIDRNPASETFGQPRKGVTAWCGFETFARHRAERVRLHMGELDLDTWIPGGWEKTLDDLYRRRGGSGSARNPP